MRNRPKEKRSVVLLSERVYRALLVLYPVRFRQDFGNEMVRSFRSLCGEEIRQSGKAGLFRLWFYTFLELLVTAAKDRSPALNTTRLSKLGGLMAFAGGGLLVAYAGIILFYELLSMSASLPSQAIFSGSQLAAQAGPLLLVGGLLGIVFRIAGAGQPSGAGSVRRRPPVTGRLGPTQILTLAGLVLAAAAAASWSSSLLLTLVNGPPQIPADSIADTLMPVLRTAGIWTLDLSTVSLGLVVWRTGILGRWRVLPAIVGASMLLLLATVTISSLLVSGPRTLPGETLEVLIYFVVPFVVLGLCWMLLGYTLRPEEADGSRDAAPVQS